LDIFELGIFIGRKTEVRNKLPRERSRFGCNDKTPVRSILIRDELWTGSFDQTVRMVENTDSHHARHPSCSCRERVRGGRSARGIPPNVVDNFCWVEL